jgi:DNA-binding transcriptional MerR regulator
VWAQQLGFTLAEVEALLDLAGGGPDSCDAVQALATEKITDLRQRIADLRALEAGLTRLVATCDLPRNQRQCPILDDLDRGPDGPSRERGGGR